MSDGEAKLDEIVEKLFAKYDTNKDGALQRDEFIVFLKDTLAQKDIVMDLSNEETINQMMKTIDKNDDKEISKSELKEALRGMYGP
eukprot:CAMPEP_0170540796 /NCGR_PEP_ID=MMETSP0211-20121228/730_1 /TAXON_ID=311385 /ORGANISM="Pseudokeronopsis sp., Strain OXSARD2" /LENGTH=85 /DNA_ID=CAMNT_0010843327 /DNA_START=15 /DNA_END=272 /DNA_ORIENTATION=+